MAHKVFYNRMASRVANKTVFSLGHLSRRTKLSFNPLKAWCNNVICRVSFTNINDSMIAELTMPSPRAPQPERFGTKWVSVVPKMAKLE